MIGTITRRALAGVLVFGAHAAAGEPQLQSLDTGFGEQGDGRQVIGLPNGEASAFGAATDAQGRILLAGGALDEQMKSRGVVIRLLPNGKPDATFFHNLTPFPEGVDWIVWNTISGTDDGGVIAAGFLQNPDALAFVCKLDDSGQFVDDFGSKKTPGCTKIIENGVPGYILSVALQQDGNIILAGREDLPYPEDGRAIVLRLTPDGELDVSFGEDGIARLPEQYFLDSSFNSLAVADDGSIAAAGEYGPNESGNQNRHMLAARFTADGKLMMEFSGGARVVPFTQLPPDHRISFASNIHVGSDGSVVLSGSTKTTIAGDTRPALVKLDANGNGVAAFGMPDLPASQRIIDACSAPPCRFGVITSQIESNGNITLAGSVTYSDLNIGKAYAMRILSDGNIDPALASNDGSFSAGVATAWWPEATLLAGAFQNGKVILAGDVSEEGAIKFAAIRFSNGILFSDNFELD